MVLKLILQTKLSTLQTLTVPTAEEIIKTYNYQGLEVFTLNDDDRNSFQKIVYCIESIASVHEKVVIL